jgi:CubicO group peptidase (beta-lactamase class C family)
MRILYSSGALTAAFLLTLQLVANSQQYDGKPIRNWWLSGPDLIRRDSTRAPDRPTMERFFNDTLQAINVVNGKPQGTLNVHANKLSWFRYDSPDDIIDFDSIFKRPDYASAYALKEIKAEKDHIAYLALGSDDAIKVWLNGKPVHSMMIARGLNPDDDLVPLSLKKGNNHLLIKVQDVEGGWGFTARFLDKTGLNTMLARAAASGKLDEAEQLIKAGADVNNKEKGILTPVVSAKLKGRGDMVKFLISKGAKDEEPPAPDILINSLYDSVKSKPYPAVVVLVAQDGRIIYKNAFGYADIENKVAATPQTKFRIGSITKQFVASAILKLEEQGKLQLSDKLSKYFPDFPRGNEVTIHHLLTHTSGIHSYTNTDSFMTKVVNPVTSEELLNYFKKIPYDFSPGERIMYNNSGYFLLGYITEKITGKKLGEYLKETFFDPLQMNNTGIYDASLKLENEAKGYQKNGHRYIPALNWNMTWAAGAGAMYSTVEDLYKWNEAVFSGKVLSAKNRELAFTPVTLNNGQRAPEMSYGYGWAINNIRGQQVIEHSGGLNGFISQLARYTQPNMTITILTNVTPPQVEINPGRLAEFYLWKKMDKQGSYSTNASGSINMKDYVGDYNFQNLGIMQITTEDNKLFAQLGSQDRFEIFPSAKDEFFWKVVEAKIRFVRNEQGKVVSGDFEQGGFKVNAPKIN